MKCLFLRTRNPPDHAFDKITQKIFGHDAYQSVAKSINERYRKSFSDYRYQLKNVLSTLVKEFRQIVERYRYVHIVMLLFYYNDLMI